MTNDAPLPEDGPPAGEGASDVPDRFTVDFSGLTLLGIYRVEEKIAEGGMGSIYSGRDENLGMRVVIKVPHVKFLSEPGFRPRFAREIKELVRLAHPHIARILAQGEHEQVPFFVLQYLGGGTLEERMEACEGPLPREEFVPWMRTMATTLDFVHARGTIHRDVKPANILFDEDGHVFLSDFGVAKVLEAEDANLTDVGTGIGSPRYMAPEQGIGGDLTPSADQYALASMLYECLADRPPFTQRSAIEILVQKSAAPPDALGDLVPDLPAAAADVVMRALAKQPEDRHDSCSAFLDAFDEASAPAPDVPAAPVPPKAKSRVVAFLVGGLLLFLAVLLVVVVGVLLRGGSDFPPPGEGAVNRIGEFEVKLVEAGAEPWRALRYRWKDAGEDALTLDYHQKVVISVKRATGMPPGTPKGRHIAPVVRDEPRLAFQVACDLDAPSAEEDLSLRWRVTEFARSAGSAEPDPTGPRADAIKEAMRGAREREDGAYRSLAGEASYSPNGLLRSHGLHDGLQIPSSSRQQLEVIAWVLRTLPIPFPVEPAGVGAIWEVTEVAEFMGMRLRHTKRYELMALDGDRVQVKASVTQIANEQELKLLETGDDRMKAKLLALTGRGHSTAVVHLDHAAPVSSSFRMRLDMEVEYSNMVGAPPGLVVPGGMVIDVDINLARR
jgi:hypothetical protein